MVWGSAFAVCFVFVLNVYKSYGFSTGLSQNRGSLRAHRLVSLSTLARCVQAYLKSGFGNIFCHCYQVRLHFHMLMSSEPTKQFCPQIEYFAPPLAAVEHSCVG